MSDLHLGENYTFLDYNFQWDWKDKKRLEPFCECVASLAGMDIPQQCSDNIRVQVETLVLLGDIFELSTAKIATAAESGRNFFKWLFEWLHPDKIVYVPGNHDHVFWVWWQVEPPQGKRNWWQKNPFIVKPHLQKKYKMNPNKTSDPRIPEKIGNKAWRSELVSYFFGKQTRESRFYVSYPAYAPEDISFKLPIYSRKFFKPVFTHGHLNDPTFVDPWKSGLRGWAMYMASGSWPKRADNTCLSTLEKDTWKYTTRYWYPHTTETTLGEALYLCSVMFEKGCPCIHREKHPGYFTPEKPPDLTGKQKSKEKYLLELRSAALNCNYTEKATIDESDYICIYGHTHHGGAMLMEHSPENQYLYNTGGWLSIVKDSPVHTHLFAITGDDVAKMVRVGYTELFTDRFKEHFRRKLLKSYSGLTDVPLF
jgi:UDP-2,3-diacylglucosamine pyrophosphatase LpxH